MEFQLTAAILLGSSGSLVRLTLPLLVHPKIASSIPAGMHVNHPLVIIRQRPVQHGAGVAVSSHVLVTNFQPTMAIRCGLLLLVVCARSIADIKWQDSRIPNTEVLRTCRISGTEAFLLQAPFRWIGHVMRMPSIRIQKQVFRGQVETGKRLPEESHKCYRVGLMQNLKTLGRVSYIRISLCYFCFR